MYICPDCHEPTVQVCSSIELGADSTSEAARLQVISCTRCEFGGAAASREPRRGGATTHRASRLDGSRYQALIDLIDSCPAQESPACPCPTHLELGRCYGGRWPGLATVGATEELLLEPSGLGRADVLIVDDDEDLRHSLVEIFEESGYAVAAARSAQEALAYLRRHEPPATILIDLMMPGMSGLKLRDQVLRMRRLRDLPVFIFTAAGGRHLDSLGLSMHHVL